MGERLENQKEIVNIGAKSIKGNPGDRGKLPQYENKRNLERAVNVIHKDLDEIEDMVHHIRKKLDLLLYIED